MVTRWGVAGVAVAALLLAALAVPREGGLAATPERLTVREYPVPSRIASSRRRARARRDGLVHGASTRASSADSTRARARSGAFRLGAGSSPHGVIVGPDGAAWVTDGGLNAIVRVDPGTHRGAAVPASDLQVRESEHGHVRSARHPLVHRTERGVRQRRSANGESARVLSAARRRSVRHRDDAVGRVYYASLAGSHIARIDTRTGRATVLQPPTRGQGARRVWSDSKSRVWVSEWNAGQGRALRARHAPLARVAVARAGTLSPTRSTSTTATSSG